MAATVISLQTIDGQTIQVEQAVGFESPVIKNIADSSNSGAGDKKSAAPPVLRVPNIKGGVLKRAMDFVDRRRHFKRRITEGDVAAKEEMKAWEAEFFRVDQDSLFDLVEGAYSLGLQELTDVVCRIIADSMKGKSVEEIRALFNIQNDYTPEEEEAVRKEHPWAFLD